MYTTPNEYYFRLHHVRPRFKNDVESVLGYVAFSIAQIGKEETSSFKAQLCKSIRQYGINAASTQKTIDNWRTEIGALFGMYVEREDGYTIPTKHTIDLANTSDLQTFFSGFVYSFQYPGGHIKPKEVSKILDAGISFHPYHWLFDALLNTNLTTIDKCEFCHCVLNDMRVTRDHESVQTTVDRIITNRRVKATYDSKGDVVRYACDLLDYAVLAGLLNEHHGVFTLNNHNRDVAKMIAESDAFFHDYEHLLCGTIQEIGGLEGKWFEYVDGCYEDAKRQIGRIVADRVSKRKHAHESNSSKVPSATLPPPSLTGEESQSANDSEALDITEPADNAHIGDEEDIAAIDENDTARIGEYGENMVLQHECMRVIADGRKDLVHLIKRIPTRYAVGYDVRSIETDTGFDRFIEVKTTKSKKPLMFKQVHLSTNEWRTAQSSGDKYCIYRLMISDKGCKLFVIRDPVQKFRESLITITPREGMDITFTEASGEEVELLCVH